MTIDIAEFYKNELKELNLLVDIFGIPGGIFKECGDAVINIYIWKHLAPEFHEYDDKETEEIIKREESKFDRLCESTPHIHRRAVEALCMAYGGFLILTKNGIEMGGGDNKSSKEDLSALMMIAMARGVAMGNFGMSADMGTILKRDAEKKYILQKAGMKGAREKNKKTDELKQWALKKSESMRGSQIDVARKLVLQIPTHLADASKSTERFIYDALRAAQKKIDTPS